MSIEAHNRIVENSLTHVVTLKYSPNVDMFAVGQGELEK